MKIPFGLREADQRMVSPKEVANGKACGCICPCCSSGLVAKQGDVQVWHFAHESMAECDGGIETAIHKMAKQLVMGRGHIWVPEYVLEETIFGPQYADVPGYRWSEKLSFQIQPAGLIKLENCVEEQSLGEIIPDITAEVGAMKIFIEIANTHFCDLHKREVLTNKNITTLEVDVSMSPDTNQEDILNELEKRLFTPNTHSTWIVHSSREYGESRLEALKNEIIKSRAEEDADFKKRQDEIRAEKQRQEELSNQFKEVDFENIKIDSGLTIRVARNVVQCTLKTYGNWTDASDKTKNAVYKLVKKFSGTRKRKYSMWVFPAPEDKLSSLFVRLVVFLKSELKFNPVLLTRNEGVGNFGRLKYQRTSQHIDCPYYLLLHEYEKEHFEERAAIIEYDGETPRAKAEEQAYFNVEDCRTILTKRVISDRQASPKP